MPRLAEVPRRQSPREARVGWLPAPLLAAALLAWAPCARADDDARCAARLGSIQTQMDREAHRTQVWKTAWLVTGLALFAGQLTAAAVTTTDFRVDLAFGAARSTFLWSSLLVRPPRIIADARTLDARLAATSVDGSFGVPCLALGRAEELQQASAEDRDLRKGWIPHALVVVGSLALGGLLGAVNGNWGRVALETAGSIAVGEAVVLTF